MVVNTEEKLEPETVPWLLNCATGVLTVTSKTTGTALPTGSVAATSTSTGGAPWAWSDTDSAFATLSRAAIGSDASPLRTRDQTVSTGGVRRPAAVREPVASPARAICCPPKPGRRRSSLHTCSTIALAVRETLEAWDDAVTFGAGAFAGGRTAANGDAGSSLRIVAVAALGDATV